SMVETYLSSISNRMNEIMKVLTIISTIFIPITFLVGLYGMNFVHMPEIRWRWGYALAWLLIIGSVGTMVAFFRKKKWL
ncbi:MAG: magnesium and cobalt transport protein CorA, partial [Candidatus Aminicenantes bacterium]